MLLLSVNVCDTPTCPFYKYTENIDFGYYSKTNGDCTFCQLKCNDDDNCGAVECGDGYCTWWKTGKCNTDEEQIWNRSNPSTTLRTCAKGKHGNRPNV